MGETESGSFESHLSCLCPGTQPVMRSPDGDGGEGMSPCRAGFSALHPSFWPERCSWESMWESPLAGPVLCSCVISPRRVSLSMSLFMWLTEQVPEIWPTCTNTQVTFLKLWWSERCSHFTCHETPSADLFGISTFWSPTNGLANGAQKIENVL